MLPDTLEPALDYGWYLGWYTFPVGPDCRSPLCRHGCKDAAKDAAEIEALWRGRHCNIALATGPHSGCLALDVDVKEGAPGLASVAALERRFGPLPESWRSRTPSGGYHLLFRHPERYVSNRIGLRIDEADGSRTLYPGLDFKALGGSIALPPSSKASGAYRWVVSPWDGIPLAEAPIWLLDIVDPPRPPAPKPKPLKFSSSNRAARYGAAALERECKLLAQRGRGQRNKQLFQSSASMGELVGAGLLPQPVVEEYLEAAAQECGLWRDDGPKACRATIASGLRKGIANPREVRS